MNLVTRDGRQFISRLFKQEAVKHSIKLIYGEPPHQVKGETEYERMCNLMEVIKS